MTNIIAASTPPRSGSTFKGVSNEIDFKNSLYIRGSVCYRNRQLVSITRGDGIRDCEGRDRGDRYRGPADAHQHRD
jgi:hypothetical protein